MKVYIDTAVLVAACIDDHKHHGPASTLLHTARARKIEAHVSAHGLAEFYSVLSRTPFAPAVYPSEAWQMLSDNILPYFTIVTLSAKEYEKTIQHCARSGWIGGRVYDALHIQCARKIGSQRIYTFNVSHFKQLAPELAGRISAP